MCLVAKCVRERALHEELSHVYFAFSLPLNVIVARTLHATSHNLKIMMPRRVNFPLAPLTPRGFIRAADSTMLLNLYEAR